MSITTDLKTGADEAFVLEPRVEQLFRDAIGDDAVVVDRAGRDQYRDPYWFPALSNADWAAQNGANGFLDTLDDRHGGKVEYAEGFVHTFNGLVPPDPYFRLHPEWFSLIDGKRTKDNAQLCTTDPELRAFVLRRVKEQLRTRHLPKPSDPGPPPHRAAARNRSAHAGNVEQDQLGVVRPAG